MGVTALRHKGVRKASPSAEATAGGGLPSGQQAYAEGDLLCTISRRDAAMRRRQRADVSFGRLQGVQPGGEHPASHGDAGHPR